MKEIVAKYQKHILLFVFFAFLVHGAKLNSNIIGIDTEDLINLGNDFYNGWLHTGRFGLVGLKYLFGNTQFNPYYTGTMTLLLMVVAFGACFMLYDSVYDVPRKESAGMLPWICGGALWISHPILVEQFYFSLQSMEICIGILLTVLALYFALCFETKKKWCYGVFAVLLLVVTFSTYQIFVVLFAFGTVVILLLQALKAVKQESVTAKSILLKIPPYLFVFLGAFLLYTIINKLFFGSSEYLQSQIAWGSASLSDCFLVIVKHVVKVFTGYHSVFYNAGYGLLALLGLFLIIRYLNRISDLKKTVFVVILLLYAALLFTPFMMTVVLGGEPAIRSQLVLPAVTGFLGYLAGKLVNWETASARGAKVLFVGSALLCLVTSLEQAKVSAGLYYTDKCRYEHDLTIAQDIIKNIERIDGGERIYPVVVIGEREFTGNDTCIMGEMIGRSFFAYDTDVQPEGYWSTRRALGFLRTCNGIEYGIISQEQMEIAEEYSSYMPGYPYDGYVQRWDDMIVVKISY